MNKVPERVEPDLADQYISVLLELYAVKSEICRPSPLEQAKVDHWMKIVRAFERDTSKKLRSRVQYRARKAEKVGLGPVQVAMVRYFWMAYLTRTEKPESATRRWLRYLTGRIAKGECLISHEHFQKRRQFRELLSGIRRADLWPWLD